MTYSFDVEKWEREREEKRKDKARELIEISKFLKKCGYKYIVTQYQGCGDSGEAMESEGYKTKKDFDKSYYDGCEYIKKTDWVDGKSIPIPKDKWKWSRNQIEVQNCMDKYNACFGTKIELEYLLADLIGYDWYNNEGGQGRVVLDITKNIVYVEGEQNTNAHIEVESKRYLDDSKPFEERVGNEVIDRGW